MYTPQTLSVALLMMITSAICWGSWANTFKGVKNYRFELFYWDYAIGIFLISLILGHTMGSTGHNAQSLVENIHSTGWSNVAYALVGGAWFNLANLLLVAAIDMAGLAVAFPISIGIALVVGVVLSYVLQPKGNPTLLALGVACALLGPYAACVFLTLGALLSCFIWNIYFMKRPLVGEPVSFSGFVRGPASGHALGLLGGFIWGTGTVFNMVAASLTGVAISYAIGQSAPMVAALWGIFAWKEFDGSGTKAKVYLLLMFVFYGLAILLVAKANG